MSTESYFVITSNEDGVSIVEHKTKDKLLASFWLGDDTTPGWDPKKDYEFVKITDFLKRLPKDLMDTRQTPKGSIIVIKGKIVLPFAKKVHSELEVE